MEKKNGRLPSLMSGHSLGEYSALVCSNAIKFSDALKIVFFRGHIMQDIIKNRPVLMQVIIGLDQKKVEEACLIASEEKKIVSLASINSKDQIVISGDKSAVCKASLNCKKMGAKYTFKLNTKISAHCALLRPLSHKLEKLLETITIHSPIIPVVNNVDVKCENTSKNIKNALIRQLYNTVRWKEIIEFIQLKKNFIMLEIGPNKILTNLNRNNKNIISLSTNNFKNFLTSLKKIT